MAAAMRSLSFICLLTGVKEQSSINISMNSSTELLNYRELTFVFRCVRTFLDVNVQFQFMRNITFDFNSKTESNKCGKRTMRHSWIEFNANLK